MPQPTIRLLPLRLFFGIKYSVMRPTALHSGSKSHDPSCLVKCERFAALSSNLQHKSESCIAKGPR